MDIDGTNSHNTEDIDQNLLLQFSCMNTTDREELISQMQILLGPSLNHNTASFFLDMSNWNLQGAICCYLDYTMPAKLPGMSLKEVQNQESSVAPGVRFEQSWSITNTGNESWSGSWRLIQAGGEPLGAQPIYVPPLPVGHSTTITLNLIAPNKPGTHRGYFHMVTDKGDQIGDTLWAEITVESEITMALVERLAAMPIPSSRIDDAISTNIHQMPSQDDQMC